ncbi:MAG: DUF5671 domain-containing protein [Acidimicrobiales bacterium]
MGAMFGGLLPLLILGGLAFAIANGLRSANDDPSDPIEPAEAAKSFALHLGLFVAFVAVSVGLIDLLQAAIDRPERLAGTSSDLARGLSLLIVAGPAFALLFRAVDRRCRERVESGDQRPTRGWSVYLVAALSTSLIATLVSVAQVADAATSSTKEVNRSEVAQLIVWFAVWLAHWFALRPRLRLRGDAHLAIATVVGLGWFLSGVGAVLFRVLEQGYDAAFGESLDSSANVALWLIVAAAGAVVWLWHWWSVFDAPAPGSSVEGERRASPLWFFTVVVAGVLPGLVALIVSVAIVVSLVAIWFLGTVDETAGEYFMPLPGLISVLFLGFVTWAYHRWVLERHGHPNELEVVRNESIRFHDYVVVAAGLVAVVSAAAALIALMIDTIAGRSSFADSNRTDNTLIVILTVLATGAVVWWHYWHLIEAERDADPEEESESFWRKLYLIASFGIGGLVLGGSLTWVLFAFLRDLFDAGLSRSTIEDLADPIGWAVAVVGGVWYHFGVWQADRAVLEARQPPPPTAPPVSQAAVAPGAAPPPAAGPVGLWSRPATAADAGELYTLQLAERGAREVVTGPVETIDELEARLATSQTTVIGDGHRIVGFVTRPLGEDHGTTGDNGSTGDTAAIQAVVAPDRNTAEIRALLASMASPGDRTS